MRIFEEDFGLIAMRICSESGNIVSIDFLAELPKCPRQDNEEILKEAVRQLREYFAGLRKEFSLPLQPKGTEFQKLVWKELQGVPYSTTASYGEIAKRIGRPKAVRAVGGANHVNPLPVVIPCHRIIGTNGSLTGYAGGLELKKQLLDLEKKYS